MAALGVRLTDVGHSAIGNTPAIVEKVTPVKSVIIYTATVHIAVRFLSKKNKMTLRG